MTLLGTLRTLNKFTEFITELKLQAYYLQKMNSLSFNTLFLRTLWSKGKIAVKLL